MSELTWKHRELQARQAPARASQARARGQARGQASAAMTERQLENAVRRIVKDLPNIWARHESDSRGALAGWPDWTFLRLGSPNGAAMFWELKTEKGKVTKAQQECIDAMLAAGLNVAVRRPSDLLSGRIAYELAALAGLRSAEPAGTGGQQQ